MAKKQEAGLLSGLRVVEIGRRIAAPVAGMLLAEQGAEVVRIVEAGAESPNPVMDAILARGKTELRLDLSTPEDRQTLYALVAQADVLLENLAPGRLALWGIDPDEIRQTHNAGLVSCRVAPFPTVDPRSLGPDYEAIAGAAGFLYDRPVGAPRYHAFPIGSVMAGIFAANATVAALIARLRLGHGQHVDTSLQGANLFAQILQVLMKTGVPRGFLALKMVATPFMGTWQCKDGRWVYLHITLPAHNALLLEMLENHGHAADVKALRGVLSEQTMSDPSQVGSISEAKKIRTHFRKIFLQRDAAEWEALFGTDLCCIVVRDVPEWLDAATASGMPDACRVDDPVFGDLRCPGPGFTAADRPPRLVPRLVAPDAEALLAAWNQAPRADGGQDAIGAPPADPGPPLAGTKVMDLSRIIAGPCAARMLAELGAEVISLQSPGSLDWALSFHLVFNAGKKTATLDFRDEAGKEKLWALMDDLQPDAFLQNYRNLDIARGAGIDPDAVRARYPEIVYTHLNAYGNHGEWRDRPGFEQVVQAVSGIQLAYGTGGKPKLLPTPVIDIGSGLFGTFGTLTGLYGQRTGKGGSFSATHLTRVAVLLQVEQIAAFQRDAALDHAAGSGTPVTDHPEARVLGGLARAREAYVCVAGPRRDLQRWLAATGFAPEGLPLDDLGAVLAGKMWRRSVDHWRESLARAGVAGSVVIEPVRSMKKLVDDAERIDPSPARLVRKRAYEGCEMELTFVRAPFELSLTPPVDVATPPLRGGDTPEVLARIGVQVPEGEGVMPYPEDKPLLVWLGGLIQWGWFAWRSGTL